MQLLGSSKNDIDQNKDGEIMLKLETVEVVLVNYNLVNSSYQQVSKVLFTFVPNKQFGQLITILLMQDFHSLKYGSQSKTTDHWK